MLLNFSLDPLKAYKNKTITYLIKIRIKRQMAINNFTRTTFKELTEAWQSTQTIIRHQNTQFSFILY